MCVFHCGNLPSAAHSAADNVVNLQVPTCSVEYSQASVPVTACDSTLVFYFNEKL